MNKNIILISAYLISMALGSQLLASSNTNESIQSLSDLDKIKIETTKENLMLQLQARNDADSFLRENPTSEEIQAEIARLNTILMNDNAAAKAGKGGSGPEPF